jgi:diacylglycerol O-acyltransferase / wax synthase
MSGWRAVVAPNEVVGTMNDADSLLWRIGTDPVLRPSIVAVVVLDRAPHWDVLQARMQELVELQPRLRSRVDCLPLGLWRPRWVEDSAFDLADHVRRMRAPEKASLRAVLDLAQVMVAGAFDPDVPLWEATLVEDLEDGTAALVIKFHHALTDGLGGLTLFAHLLSESREPPAPRPPSTDRDPAAAAARPSGARWSERLVTSLPRLGSSLTGNGGLPGLVAGAAQRASNLVAEAPGLAASAARLLAPAGRPLSPVMSERGGRRHLEVIDLPAGVLGAAAKAAGGTLNDLFVAASVDGVRRYHELHDAPIGRVRMLMPVSVRRAGDPDASNRFVPVRFVLPVSGDPQECVHAVRTLTQSMKNTPALAVSDFLAAGLDLLPPSLARSLWGSMLRGDDFCATNMPGPASESYLAGARLERVYAFAPPSGAAFNISLLTMASGDCVGLTIDKRAVPDGPALASCIREGLEEMTAVAPST